MLVIFENDNLKFEQRLDNILKEEEERGNLLAFKRLKTSIGWVVTKIALLAKDEFIHKEKATSLFLSIRLKQYISLITNCNSDYFNLGFRQPIPTTGLEPY